MTDHATSTERIQVEVPPFVSFTKTYHNKPYDDISPTRPELSAAGKNVVVTGGGTGIGKAIATAFTQAGAKSVAILGRRLDKLEAAVDNQQEEFEERLEGIEKREKWARGEARANGSKGKRKRVVVEEEEDDDWEDMETESVASKKPKV